MNYYEYRIMRFVESEPRYEQAVVDHFISPGKCKLNILSNSYSKAYFKLLRSKHIQKDPGGIINLTPAGWECFHVENRFARSQRTSYLALVISLLSLIATIVFNLN